jgi:hypothetical protein
MPRTLRSTHALVLSGALIATMTAGLATQPASAERPEPKPHTYAVDDGALLSAPPTFAPARRKAVVFDATQSRQQAGRRRKTKVTATWSTSAPVPVGTPVSVSGRVKDNIKSKRKVLLQQRIKSGWRTIDTDRTTKRGAYGLNVNTTYFFTSALRVVAPPVRRSGGDRSAKQRIQSYAPYVPFGTGSEWSLLLPKYELRWNPCQTITYRVNSAQGIPGSDADVTAALAQVSQATGLRFKYKGTTTHIPGGSGKWPKGTNVVIAWNTQAQTTVDLTPPVLARGGISKSVWAKIGNKRKINGKRIAMGVRGGVNIDSTRPLPNNDYQVKLLMHEIGHVVGLGHYPNAGQIMDGGSSMYNLPTQWSNGDLTGLEHVGLTGGCLKPIRR